MANSNQPMNSDKEGIIFKNYEDKKIIAQQIYNDFINLKYQSDITNDLAGFFLSDGDRSNVGTLTQCSGLSTLALLQLSGAAVYESQDIIFKTLDDLFNRVIREDKYIFDASPYLKQTNEDLEMFIDDYMETLTKVFIAMLDTRNMLYEGVDNKRFSSQYENQAVAYIEKTEQLIKVIMQKFNSAALKYKKPVEYRIDNKLVQDRYARDCEYRGWNFSASNQSNEFEEHEPSLYYGYIVSNAYIVFLNYFKVYIEEYRTILNNKENGNDLAKKLKRWILEETVMDLPEEIGKAFFEEKEADVLTEKYNRDKEFFYKKVFKEFIEFNKCCVDLGHSVDMELKKKIDFTEEFVGNNFTPVSSKEISSSTTNDALFNTLFVLGILINSGTDMDYEDKGGETRARQFFEDVQYAYQNVQRCYKKLVNEDKEHIVEQYYININEKVPNYLIDKAKLLRKQRIQAMNLKPLMIQVFFSISKYLVMYPQKEAIVNREIILEDRYAKVKGKECWYWDKDGYNVFTNLAYIEALVMFYGYYEKYEERFLGIQEKNNIRDQQMEDKHKKELEEKKNAYEKSERENGEKYNKEKKALLREIELYQSKKEPLLVEIENVIEKKVNNMLESKMKEIFEEIIKSNESNVKNDFSLLLKDLFLSYFNTAIKYGMDDELRTYTVVKERLFKQYQENSKDMIQKIYYETKR